MTPKQRPDAERLYLFVQHLSRNLRDIEVSLGLSAARLSALVSLRFHGVNNIGALAKIERVSRPAMTRLVRDMERAGLVRRHPDASDGRGVLVALTKKGADAVDRAKAKKVAFVAERLKRAPAKERAALLDWLDRMNEGP